MDDRAEDLIKRHGRLKADRSVLDSHCQEIAERVWPDHATFTHKPGTQGEKRTEKMFDSTAALALSRYGAAMESYLTPRTAQWHRLRVRDEKLNARPAVARFLEALTKLLFQVRYASRSNYASHMHEAYMSIGAFGTGVSMSNDMLGRGIRYTACAFADTWFAEDQYGMHDTVHREFLYTGQQAQQKFTQGPLPEKVVKAGDEGDPKLFTFLHCVKPNEEANPRDRSYRGMKYSSYYVCVDEKATVDEGGYRTMPYSIGRGITAPGESYGRSPAMLALPDIKMLNEMEKTILRAAHKKVDPPWLLHKDSLQAFASRPNAMNYGGMTAEGRPLAMQAEIKGDIGLGIEITDGKRKLINDHFLVTLFQILVDSPQITATEALLRAQEKGALIAPTMGRQQSELLGPQIERDIDLCGHAGLIPPIPRELIEAGGTIEIEYVSPLNRLQRSEEGVAILRTAETLGVFAQVDPSVTKVVDMHEAVRMLAEIQGVPSKIIRTPEEVDEILKDDAQQVQLQNMLAAAPIAAQTAKTLAETQQLGSQGVPAVPLYH
jgi:hypothetical protein